jgi:hypothetical protein
MINTLAPAWLPPGALPINTGCCARPAQETAVAHWFPIRAYRALARIARPVTRLPLNCHEAIAYFN